MIAQFQSATNVRQEIKRNEMKLSRELVIKTLVKLKTHASSSEHKQQKNAVQIWRVESVEKM